MQQKYGSVRISCYLCTTKRSFYSTTSFINLNVSIAAPRKRTRSTDTEQLNALIIEGIRDKKGKNIVQLDLRHLDDAPTDFFIICEGDSNVHVKAISEGVYQHVKEASANRPIHTEGSSNSKWILMDYFDTVVHVFYPETREFYELENLWSDAAVTEFADV